jgi:hypothetical protein
VEKITRRKIYSTNKREKEKENNSSVKTRKK